ncbi:MFS transporter, UMF1 family [Halanaerobium congolense]|jgi:UMF1 family MFS transporter|uniref:MFS transporter, UMF1 family n=1 Tax=Halanaerobium congolense TaxID=54121 RepID=A0A1I0C940_9FIRM|nr:MFS transporter [Halanaerobium congolense]PTX15727.1 UMF1 family MFS transporter [Halanaerobium congolense]SDF93068.1 MFS transporter, UMF1 family [Halanaerobium congolense]SET15901.1 MFS transporter, UMF1 family [Halanaerobium congolense]SFP62000.1 MFS transporter, UMF1 family [Halanaerobium congolense]
MDKQQKTIYAWALYDWANSAFATVILATILPIFYKDVAGINLPGNLATSYWGYTQTIAMIIIAAISPILGAAADYSDSKKSFLKFFVILGITGTVLLFFVNEGNYLLASFFFIIANIGFSGGNVFYDGFLTDISDSKSIDYISSLGYAAGYLGGGLLLAVNLIMISKPALFSIGSTTTAIQISFVTVAVWWFVFSLPAFKYLPDPQKRVEKIPLKKYAKMAFGRLKSTFINIRKYRELWKFLLAFWIYNDGIGTIIRMATIYGREVGIGQTDLIGALLLTQFVGIPFALIFAKIAGKITAKKGIYLALTIYIGITLYGYFLDSALDFWILAGIVGMVQGGAQALSRSLYGAMVPESKSAEFFGFFGVSSKFAAIIGPTVFAYTGQLTGSSRYGILAVAAFFILGMFFLSRVDVEKGKIEAKN